MAEVIRLRPEPPRAVLGAWRVLAESGRVGDLTAPECRSTRAGLVWYARGRLPGHGGVHSFRLSETR